MSIIELLPEFVAIPEATFLMGTPEQELSTLAQRYGGTRESYREESPQHQVTVPAFALARVPVTTALYAIYVQATGAQPPLNRHQAQPPAELLNHPVVDVSWNDARNFCAWLNEQLAAIEMRLVDTSGQTMQLRRPKTAFRLPREAEWEYAARGTDGRLFPWGNTFDPAHANTRESGMKTTPVGHYSMGASPYGLLDMAGNVWEWTATQDRLYPYAPADGREDLEAPGRRILRGGCYANPQGFARCACRFRLLPTVRNEFLGFRPACNLPAGTDEA